MALSDIQFQKMSGVIGHVYPAFSRESSIMSENQPRFQENTSSIRHRRLSAGQSLSFTNYFWERSIQVSLQQNTVPPQITTGVTASWQIFPSIANRYPFKKGKIGTALTTFAPIRLC
jgi:hypothetical protein